MFVDCAETAEDIDLISFAPCNPTTVVSGIRWGHAGPPKPPTRAHLYNIETSTAISRERLDRFCSNFAQSLTTPKRRWPAGVGHVTNLFQQRGIPRPSPQWLRLLL